ncbi:MAG: hypothetical protein U0V74_03745 [Chitinophagales bacterium]
MKKLLLLLSLITAFTFISSAQGYQPEDLVKFKQDTISRYFISKIKSNQVYIPMDFNSADIKDLTAYREIKDYSILKVELVYTAYQKSEYFDQPKLNIDRLTNLQEQAPELFSSSLTKWKFIAQTECETEEDARKLFHGFVISYRPEPAIPFTADMGKSMSDKVNLYVKLVADVADRKPGAREKLNNSFPELRDSAVLSVMNRKQGWKDMPVVCDVTGSMSPYLLQTMVWFKLHAKTAGDCSYTFFNDGDNTPDDKKIIGNTGGVYFGRVAKYDSVENLMLRAMFAGSGGDAPENNIEALIRTQEKMPACKEIIMIADNYANVKDIAFLEKVNKPVHIILCGVMGGINVDYLNIARATGGSVHTIEKDIEDLAKVNEGEIFVIKGQKFKLEKGRFKLVYES